ncbi:MAG: LytTR family DNA-binding domain-containing protein [Cytophagaceae bacterium]|jgi:two-component system LytT family response regulator|nr:LytTR family DNA-binding domain-containing protein [Cytophagaceae bacterium]
MSKSAIIIDDEQQSVLALMDIVKHQCPNLEVLATGNSVAEGVKLIKQHQPELLFLDVEMGDGTGFDLLESIKDEFHCKIIFVTAFDHYALKAFRFCALDYLLKPVDPDLLKEAVDKLNQSSTSDFSNKIKILQSNLNGNKRIVLPSKEEFFVAEIQEIIRCEANGNYTIIYLTNHKPILVSKTLKDFDDLLNEFSFLRIHKSHLINMDYVEKYLPKEGKIAMKDGSEVELSRRKKESFLQRLFNS